MHTRIQVGLMMVCLLLALLVASCSSTRPDSTTEVSTNDTTTSTLPEENNTPTEIKVGDKGLLTRNMVINVMNPEPIGDYRYGNFGDVYADSPIQLVAKGNEEEGFLVRYTDTSSNEDNECPTGTLFFMSEEEFRSCKEYYDTEEGKEKEQETNKERIRELLKQEKVNSQKQ